MRFVANPRIALRTRDEHDPPSRISLERSFLETKRRFAPHFSHLMIEKKGVPHSPLARRDQCLISTSAVPRNRINSQQIVRQDKVPE
jgi:hypothetical protein